MKNKKLLQITCPLCGYKMPLYFDSKAEGRGIYLVCKGRNCKHTFEVKIEKGKQI